MNMKIKITRTTEQATSAEIVASVDDLLIQILLRLPIRSLIQFKLVSKHWLSLITTPEFSLLRNPNPNPAIGLFLPRTAFRVNPKFEYVHFDINKAVNPPFQKLKFTKDASGIRILQSCNGLLLCSSFRASRSDQKYYIYNPTTKQYTILPELGRGSGISRSIRGVNLAFNPSRSPHYKVVCIWSSDSIPDRYQIEIYSSETGPWRVSREPFSANVDFATGVYWNGSIHWINTWGDDSTALCYNVELERLGMMPMPPVPDGSDEGRTMAYFGESCDHLHLIERYPQIQLRVYEMKRDYSDWFVKYQVDLEAVTIDFPEMIRSYGDSRDLHYYAFLIFTLIRGERDEGSFLVLQIPGNAIRYNIESKTFEKLCDFDGDDVGGFWPFQTRKAFEYIESLCYV